MHLLDVDEFQVMLRKCAGDGEHVTIDGDIADRGFTDLGYDSLALLEVQGQIERKFGISLPDDVFMNVHTPRAAVAVVNDRLTGTV